MYSQHLDLRLQLLEADQYPFLFKTLFGLLMLLPQSTAFETLKNRLSTVTSLGVMQVMPKTGEKVKEVQDIDFATLLTHFSTLQQQHAAAIRSST
jgi:vacuole morphology and inheritance protein 14